MEIEQGERILNLILSQGKKCSRFLTEPMNHLLVLEAKPSSPAHSEQIEFSSLGKEYVLSADSELPARGSQVDIYLPARSLGDLRVHHCLQACTCFPLVSLQGKVQPFTDAFQRVLKRPGSSGVGSLLLFTLPGGQVTGKSCCALSLQRCDDF